ARKDVSVSRRWNDEPADVGAVKVAIAAEPEEGHGSANKPADPDKCRRKRCPTYKSVTVHPVNPCRRPFGARDPCPTIGRIKKPSPVVAGRPAPGIIRDPRPSCVSIFPRAVNVRSPARDDIEW